MRKKILIVGSTGKLGTKLLNFISRNSIDIYGISCFKNANKLIKQRQKYSIKHSFVLSNEKDQKKFLKIIMRLFFLG